MAEIATSRCIEGPRPARRCARFFQRRSIAGAPLPGIPPANAKKVARCVATLGRGFLWPEQPLAAPANRKWSDYWRAASSSCVATSSSSSLSIPAVGYGVDSRSCLICLAQSRRRVALVRIFSRSINFFLGLCIRPLRRYTFRRASLTAWGVIFFGPVGRRCT